MVHGAACWVLRGTHKLICCIGSARLLRFHVDAQVCDMKLVHLRDWPGANRDLDLDFQPAKDPPT